MARFLKCIPKLNFMKILNLVPAVLISAALCVSCNDEQNKDENVTTSTETTTTVVRKPGEGKRTVVTIAQVPEPVVASFKSKAEKADEIEWQIYDPIPEDNWDSARDYYFVTYRLNHIPWEAWISNDGELIKAEERIFLANSGPLPTEVVKSIMENYPGYEIENVSKENDKDMDMFEVELKKDGAKAKVKFLPDGSVFKSKEKEK